MNGGISQFARVLADVERRAPSGIADLRSAIQAAVIAMQEHREFCNSPFPLSELRFGISEAKEIDAINVVRDALGALGLGPGEINALGEVLT